MNNFQELETSALLEMLGHYTSQLTSMLVKTVTAKEYENCKKTIEELQLEITSRTARSQNKTVPHSDRTVDRQ